MQMLPKIDVVFSLFLDEFPANYTDLVEYAELSKLFLGHDDLLQKLYTDATTVLNSLERWAEFCKLSLYGTKYQSASW